MDHGTKIYYKKRKKEGGQKKTEFEYFTSLDEHRILLYAEIVNWEKGAASKFLQYWQRLNGTWHICRDARTHRFMWPSQGYNEGVLGDPMLNREHVRQIAAEHSHRRGGPDTAGLGGPPLGLAFQSSTLCRMKTAKLRDNRQGWD